MGFQHTKYILLILGIAYLLIFYLFVERLKTRHADVWRQLGEPQFYSVLAWFRFFSIYSFLLKKQYADLGDPVLMKLGHAFRWVLWALLLYFPIKIALMYAIKILA